MPPEFSAKDTLPYPYQFQSTGTRREETRVERRAYRREIWREGVLVRAVRLAAGHSEDTDGIADLGNLIDGEGTLASTEEVFPCLRGVTFRFKLATANVPCQSLDIYLYIRTKHTSRTYTASARNPPAQSWCGTVYSAEEVNSSAGD